jgi:hypothetical protein
MSRVPLTPTELDDLLATLHACGSNAPRWQLEPPETCDRGLILNEPEGMRLLIEVPVGTPERLQVTSLFPVSPEGHAYLPYTQAAPAITVARARGMQALATTIVAGSCPSTSCCGRRHRHAIGNIVTPWPVRRPWPPCWLRCLAVSGGRRQGRWASLVWAWRRQPSRDRPPSRWRETSP